MEEAIEQYGYENILNSTLQVTVYDYGAYYTSSYKPDENVTPKTFLNFPVGSEKDLNYNNVDFIYCLTLDFYPTYSNGLYGNWQLPLSGKIESDALFDGVEDKLSGWPFFETESKLNDSWCKNYNYDKANYSTSGFLSRNIYI